MKFGRLLRDAVPELPELESLFRCYKSLKKQIKRYPRAASAEESVGSASTRDDSDEDGDDDERPGPSGCGRDTSAEAAARVRGAEGAAGAAAGEQEALPRPASDDDDAKRRLSENEAEFADALLAHLQEFNNTFVEKEEAAELRLQELEEASASASSPEEVHGVYQALKQYHGDMLLLMHWSTLAYTGTVKILKKHHKHTGHLLEAPCPEDLLMQPFCSTEVCTGLLQSAEEHMRGLMEQMGEDGGGGGGRGGGHLVAQLNLGQALGLRSNMAMEGAPLPLPASLSLKQGLSDQSEYGEYNEGGAVALEHRGNSSFSRPGVDTGLAGSAGQQEEAGNKRKRPSSGTGSPDSAGREPPSEC
eukprot:jgi/Tetstr1/449174/TSEL_036382.t1